MVAKTKSKKESFMQGVVALMFSQVLIKLLGLIYKLYLTNREGFGDEGNAIYASSFQIYALLLAVTSIGIPNAIAKLISSKVAVGDNKGAYRIFKIAIAIFGLLGFLGSTVLFIFAHTISNNYLGIPEAEISLMALAPSIFLVAVGAVLRGYFNGREKFNVTANSQSIEQVLKTILTIIVVEIFGIISKKNTVIMVGAASIATTFSTFLSFLYLYIYYIKSKKEIWKEVVMSTKYKKDSVKLIIKSILLVALPISISALLSAMNRTIDTFTVVKSISKFISIEEAKIQYGILTGKIETLISLPYSFNITFAVALVPSISGAIAKGNMSSAKKKIKLSMFSTILIGIVCTSIFFFFAEPILKILFPKASSGAEMLKLCSWSIIFVVLTQTITGVMQGLGQFKIIVLILGIGCATKLILNLTLLQIQKLGIYGAIIATLISQFIVCVLNIVYLIKFMKRDLNSRNEI